MPANQFGQVMDKRDETREAYINLIMGFWMFLVSSLLKLLSFRNGMWPYD